MGDVLAVGFAGMGFAAVSFGFGSSRFRIFPIPRDVGFEAVLLAGGATGGFVPLAVEEP